MLFCAVNLILIEILLVHAQSFVNLLFIYFFILFSLQMEAEAKQKVRWGKF